MSGLVKMNLITATKTAEPTMDREAVANIIRSRRAELEALGVAHLSLFGSVARGDHTSASDVDVAIEIREEGRPLGLKAIGQLMDIEEKLSEILGVPVDVITEPVRKLRLQEEIQRDRFRVY
jgi:uncharacterized protein